MKRYPSLLLLAVIFLSGCFGPSSSPLLQKSPYDSNFNHYANRVSGKKQKTKHLKKMEWAYQLAQKSDLIAVDSMLNLEKPDRWLYINALHRRIQDRQQKVLALPSLESKEGYHPDLVIVNDIAERESASRQESAQFLFQQSEDHLATGTRTSAREAYALLENLMDNYYPDWENAQALLDSAARAGVEHVLVEGEFKIKPQYLDSKWQKFYTDPYAHDGFDIMILSHGVDISVSPDWESTSSYTVEKQIETGYVEKKDSAGTVIERTPIYETVSATVTEKEVRKSADGHVSVDIINGYTGVLIYSGALDADHFFSDNTVSISGDVRAFDSAPMEKLFVFSPTYWAMENAVLDELELQFKWLIKSRLWTGEK